MKRFRNKYIKLINNGYDKNIHKSKSFLCTYNFSNIKQYIGKLYKFLHIHYKNTKQISFIKIKSRYTMEYLLLK